MRRLLPLAALAAAAAVGFALHTPSAPAPVAAPVVAPVPAPSDGWAWRVGTGYRYALRYSSDQTVRRAMRAGETLDLSGHLELAGELTWRVHAERPAGGWIVGVQLTELTQCALTVMDQPAELDRAAVAAQEALLTLAADGRVEAVHVAPEAPSLVKHVLQGLAGQLEAVVRPEAHWQVQGRTALGATEDTYRRAGDEVRRARTYTRLLAAPQATPVGQGHATLALVDGHLDRLQHAVELTAQGPMGTVRAKGAFELSLLGTQALRAHDEVLARLDRLEARAIGVPVASAEALRNALVQRVAGLTGEQLLDDLLRFGPGGAVPDHARWLWRASGLLLLHPELCAQLEGVFTDPSLGGRGRALVTDLLAGAGSPQAQTSLRRILEGDAARNDPEHGLLLQRFTQVTEPTAESMDWLGQQFTEGPAPLPAAFALGAAIDRAPDAGQADALYGQLERAVEANPEHRGALLRALGNTARPEVADTALRYVADPDPNVRSSAALALRHTDKPAAVEALIALANDPEVGAAGAALDTLVDLDRAGRLSPEAKAQLAAAAQAGQVHAQGKERLAVLLGADAPAM